MMDSKDVLTLGLGVRPPWKLVGQHLLIPVQECCAPQTIRVMTGKTGIINEAHWTGFLADAQRPSPRTHDHGWVPRRGDGALPQQADDAFRHDDAFRLPMATLREYSDRRLGRYL